MTAARRLAAILAADIVGYSRLMGEDEAGTAKAVRERREASTPIVAGHGGRIVKTTGDGLLMEFPSVVAAVQCAIAIQKLMTERNAETPEDKRILYRIGVNLGDVLIEGDDIVGDGVNIAARLEGICEPGGVFVSGTGYDHVRGRVDAIFADLGEKDLKNIARPVRVYAIRPGSEGAAPAQSAFAPNTQGPPRLSLVVLPFANMSDDPEQEYFVDGVTESLTTDLSRVSGSFVIARNTAFTYRGKAFDVTKIGRELNVRYVIEGSVQRSGMRMRVNVQLVDAQSGNHLWAERFEKPVTDLFDMQDEIVSRIANTLNSQLVALEARRAGRAPTPDSMDLYFQGLASVNKGVTFENMAKARGFFERALALDPINVDARVGLATVDVNVGLAFVTDDRAARLAAAEAAATEAVSLAPEHAIAHLNLGLVLGFINRSVEAIAECERALTLDRNLVAAQAIIGQNKLYIGRGEETEAHVQEALRLSPRDPWVYTWLMIAGNAKAVLGRPEEAISWLRRSVESNRNYPLSRFILAAALANLGRMEEARSEVKTALALDPRFTIASFRAIAWSDNPVFLAQRANVTDGMRKAGVPDE
jgi:TolB-like protein/class 3 adenylate cyclase/tetratricopeptide (TPR) repeat protein